MAEKKLCLTNKDALRWCKSRLAIIEFANWRANIGFNSIPSGTTCLVTVTNLKKKEESALAPWQTIDTTLLGAVNKWIKHLNKIKKS